MASWIIQYLPYNITIDDSDAPRQSREAPCAAPAKLEPGQGRQTGERLGPSKSYLRARPVPHLVRDNGGGGFHHSEDDACFAVYAGRARWSVLDIAHVFVLIFATSDGDAKCTQMPELGGLCLGRCIYNALNDNKRDNPRV